MFFWHVHHDVLLEWSSNIEERIEYVKTQKPEHERETRLRLLRPVVGKLPRAYSEALRAYDEARQAYDKARRAYDKARRNYNKARLYDKAWRAYVKARPVYDEAERAYVKARRAYASAIEALHAQECPGCPWNGKTIFP